MQTKHLSIKHGAKVTAIDAVAHSTYKGVASWYFIGDLEWPGDITTYRREIAPFVLCADHDNPEAKAELDKVLGAMSDHLLAHGEWHKMKFAKDGRAYSWTPKAKEGRTPLP